MEYKKLADVYQELEKTTKRLEKTFIISEFLKTVSESDLNETVLLLQGRVFPDWDERKIGVASRLMLKAINKATGIDTDKIEKEWAKVGDLGDVAEEFIKKKKQATLVSHKLTVKKVFDNIRKLSGLEGAGTVNKKISLIAELLTSAKPEEAKYIVRTLLEELRVGTAKGTLRDAIVWAYFPKAGVKYNEKTKQIEVNDRKVYNDYVDKVQKAYDMSNDFGLVAEKAKKGKIKAIGLEIGKPIKVMLGPKEKDAKSAFERVGKPCQAEYKYDGFRCITGHTPVYVNNRGLISVKDVKIGDYVLTHKGNFKKVIAVNKRTIDKKERLFEISSYYGNKFRISEKHPVLVYKNKPLWTNIEDLTKKDKLVFPVPKIIQKFPYKNELILKDESGYSKNIKVTNFFFRFLGYWIGDGFTNDYHNTERVGLIFNAKKGKKLASFYKRNIKELFKIEKISENIHNGALYLYWRDKQLRIWLSTYFRREWKGKMLPLWFYGITKSQFDSFMQGLIESDGHIDKIGRIIIHTKERDLAMIISLLGLKFKKMIGIKRLRINNKTYYRLVVPKSKKYYQFKENLTLISILDIKEVSNRDPRIRLYNLQIEDDESYCTSMMCLHNCQIHRKGDKIWIFTRNLENVTKQFPEVVKYVKSHVKGKDFILDSEAVGFDPKLKSYLPFQRVSQRIKRKYHIEQMAKDYPVEVNIFDIIAYKGESMINEEFKKRRALLNKIVKNEKWKIVLSKARIVKTEKEVDEFYKESVSKGHEGLMLKKLDAPYKPGARVGYMVKLKGTMEPFDLVIIEAQWGEGKRAKWFSSFTLACLDDDKFVEIGKVGTGIKEKAEEGVSFDELTKLLKPLVLSQKGKNVKVKPKIVVEVLYEEIQKSPTYSSGYALRFPRVIRLRHMEKSPKDATTLKEVKRYYKQQKK